MYCKNIKNSYVGYSSNGMRRYIAPNDVAEVEDEEAKRLIEHGFFVEVGKEDAKAHEEKVAAEVQEKKESVAIPVEAVQEKKVSNSTVVNCAAVTKSGKPCSGTAVIPFGEYDADTPYFCGRHKGENPEDYERVNGEWARKQGR